ncbi:hypothetical protein VTN00DRAFT_4206 [Thermoascus crustaceus]|uniref:uncharacterized protein n=1 Tax=Thermoascus crustaceus TaxID=5088 RepID=UPI0037427BDC
MTVSLCYSSAVLKGDEGRVRELLSYEASKAQGSGDSHNGEGTGGGRAGVFVSASSRPGVDRDDPVESIVSAALSSMERGLLVHFVPSRTFFFCAGLAGPDARWVLREAVTAAPYAYLTVPYYRLCGRDLADHTIRLTYPSP